MQKLLDSSCMLLSTIIAVASCRSTAHEISEGGRSPDLRNMSHMAQLPAGVPCQRTPALAALTWEHDVHAGKASVQSLQQPM